MKQQHIKESNINTLQHNSFNVLQLGNSFRKPECGFLKEESGSSLAKESSQLILATTEGTAVTFTKRVKAEPGSTEETCSRKVSREKWQNTLCKTVQMFTLKM